MKGVTVVRRTVGERVDAGVTVKIYHLRRFTDGSTALVKKKQNSLLVGHTLLDDGA